MRCGANGNRSIMQYKSAIPLLCAAFMAGCMPSDCAHIEEYTFQVVDLWGDPQSGGQTVVLEFYPENGAWIAFPQNPIEALQIKDGDGALDRTRLEASILRRAYYSSEQPLIIEIKLRLEDPYNGSALSVDNVGTYSGVADTISLYLHRSQFCPLPLDSESIFLSEPIQILAP